MVLCKMMGTLPGMKKGNAWMITLYHCDGARSFRPLWMLEEMGLDYELKMLPFPPRVFAKEYLALNPLGTIPFMVDGETKMTESSGICHYLGMKYGPTPLMVGESDPGLWRVPELDVFLRRHADLPADPGAPLQPARAGGAAQSAGRDRLCQMVPGAAARGGGSDRKVRDAVRRPFHRSRHRDRLRACGSPARSALPRISVPMSPPTGTGCSSARRTSGRWRPRRRPGSSRMSHRGCGRDGRHSGAMRSIEPGICEIPGLVLRTIPE